MTLDAETCYRALRARDDRFDGVFFVAVSTTGIYCRPVCPARTPARDRCTFFTCAAEAERAGFRACFRCRPELAPGLATVDSIPRLVRQAAARIHAGYLNEHGVDDLAAELGVTARHLRRAMEQELGVSPVELAQTQRLALAKQLLQGTAMPLASIAFAAGFASVRRFNALFRERFGRAPTEVRRAHGESADATLTIRLDYRPPLAWAELLAFLAGRAIPGVEAVEGGVYARTVRLGDTTGWVRVRSAGSQPALVADIAPSLAPKLMEVVARLRALFDLDARPRLIDDHLASDPHLARLVRATPGLRVPGAFDPFETAARAVLGQQVSVRAATTLSGRLAERFGARIDEASPGLGTVFPRARDLAQSAVATVKAIGLPEARARTLVALARAVDEGRVDLSATADPTPTLEALEALPGIGPWTAHYLAMRALHWPNAFPAGDLGVRKALGVTTSRAAEERARPWEPWRAYAVFHLWSSLSQGG